MGPTLVPPIAEGAYTDWISSCLTHERPTQAAVREKLGDVEYENCEMVKEDGGYETE
jgi:hypothetical protein